MKRAYLIGLILLFFSLTGCKTLIGIVSKNWRETLIEQQTPDYTLHVDANLSGGCPQSSWWLSQDSIVLISEEKTTTLVHVVYDGKKGH